MPRLRFTVSMSLDGYIAGPDQSPRRPLGVGGEALHQWAFELAAWRRPHGLDGGVVNESSGVMDDSLRNVGAWIMGRNMFGGHPGPWKNPPWNGWWKDRAPFHCPVFVVTHHAREPLTLADGTAFHFVTEGADAAFDRAHAAAVGKDIRLGGGANIAQQFLRAGLIDEMTLSVVPILLGAGERLFDNVGHEPGGLRHVETVPAPGVTHFRFVRDPASRPAT